MGKLSSHFVFLAASYPSREYAEKADSREIARAVKAFLGAVFHQHGKVVFGGHPSISPLVLMMAREYGEKGRVCIYQSELYRPLVVGATLDLAKEEFGEIKFVEGEPGESPEPGKCQRSLRRMRENMIQEANPIAAVFIGGDTGLKEEFDLFLEKYPKRPVIPVGAPGGIARELAMTGGNIALHEAPSFLEQLIESRNYNALMRRVVDHIAKTVLSSVYQGTIKRVIRDRGFGFIRAADGQEVFFDRSSLQHLNFDSLKEGENIEFEVERGEKGQRAATVRPGKSSRS